MKKIFAQQFYSAIFAFPNGEREISSAGSEHLVYTEGVGGSNPSFPTKSLSFKLKGFFTLSLEYPKKGN